MNGAHPDTLVLHLSLALSGGRDASAIEQFVLKKLYTVPPTRGASDDRRELFFTRKNVQSPKRSLILNRPISPITDINIADSEHSSLQLVILSCHGSWYECARGSLNL
jgi:hypothetical protein